MKNSNVVLVLLVLLSLAGNAVVSAADNIWTNGTGSGLWNDPNNWALGYVPVYGEDGVDVQFIQSLPGPVVRTPGMEANQLRLRNKESALTIDGGTLAVGGASLLGNTKKRTATVTVNSGTLEFADSASLPRWGTGILNMNGGDFIAAKLKVGTNSYGKKGYINLYGGVIAVTTNEFVLGNNLCKMDVTGGTLIVHADVVYKLQSYINKGRITSCDGRGRLYLDYDITNPGKTTLTGCHFLKPNPADGLTVPASLDRLGWTLPDPNSPASVVTCDVYFGTDPNRPGNPIIADHRDGVVDSVPVALDPFTTYYWSVDLYDSDISDTEPFHRSPVFTFNTHNQPPIVNAGFGVATWLADGPRVLPLVNSVTDDGLLAPLEFFWTVAAEPNDLNPALISDPLAAVPTITLAEPGAYTVQLAVCDGEFTVTDTTRILVYADSCKHAQSQPGFVRIASDLHYDCRVNLLDLAEFAADWLSANYSIE